MHSIRFVMGRPRGERSNALQSIQFDAREWTERDARAWLDRQGYDPRNLDKSGGWFCYRVRDKSVFIPRTLRAVDTGRREKVTMSSNPKKRRAKKRPKKNPAKRRPRAKRVKRSAAPKAKTTRTKVTTLKVMRTNARPKKKRTGAKRRRRVRRLAVNRRTVKSVAPRSASRFTLAFTPQSARRFAQVARLSVARRREMLRALRSHPSGGVFVNSPAWHGSREQATKLAARVRLILAYAAGRRRKSLNAASVPRVVAVP